MFVDLSFPIEDGTPTIPGLVPEARIGAYLDHDASRERYQGKAEFLLGKHDIPGNTATYVDAPFHRYRDREDLSRVGLERLAGIRGMVVDGPSAAAPIDIDVSATAVRGRAVLIRTGWDRHWGTDAYFQGDPWLSAATLDLLIDGGATLLGVDFNNVDDTSDPERPAHTRLLGAGIPIVEHLRGLDALPRKGFRFFAVPPAIVGGASFPVRAFAELPDA